MPKNFYQIAAAASKDVEIAGVRITLQRLLHLEGEPIHATAHVGMTGRNPHAYA